MTYRSKIMAVAGLVMGLALAGAPAHAQQPAAKQAAPAPAPPPALKPASPAALAAAKEILTMDVMKKEIVYNLGLVFEQMGDPTRSVACMKQIYEADYGYKDVAVRVESSYEQKQPQP